MKLPNRIIDLTHPTYVGMPTYDTTPAFKATRLRNYEPDGYRLTALEITTHSGTHIDAPCHFMSGTPKTLSECQVEQFISFGAVLDVPQEPDGGITLEDCERAAAKLGREIEPGEIILLHTGFQDRYGSDPDLFAHHHAFVTGPAAEWLVSKKPKVVGIDATSFEFFGARIPDTSPAHNALLSAEILLVEELINLDKISSTRPMIVVAPLHLSGSDGAPCRVFALEWE